MDSYDIRFWDIKKLGNGTGARYRVRWAVDGREHCKSFKARLLADGFLTKLKDAIRDGQPFNPRPGLPEAEVTEEELISRYAHARAHTEVKWANPAPVSRRSIAEALVTVTIALSEKEPGAPEPRVLGQALFAWAFNPATRDITPPLVLRGAAPVGGGHAPGVRPAPAEDRVGGIVLSASASRAGRVWTDEGTARQERGLKHRAGNETRTIPIPPVLVRLLRAHIKRFGTTLDGRVFQTARGGILQDSGYNIDSHITLDETTCDSCVICRSDLVE